MWLNNYKLECFTSIHFFRGVCGETGQEKQTDFYTIKTYLPQ